MIWGDVLNNNIISLLIMDNAGIPLFKWSKRDLFKNVSQDVSDEVLLSGLLLAINSFARALGNELKSISMNGFKLFYRNIDLSEDARFLVVFFVEGDANELVFTMKLELACRWIFSRGVKLLKAKQLRTLANVRILLNDKSDPLRMCELIELLSTVDAPKQIFKLIQEQDVKTYAVILEKTINLLKKNVPSNVLLVDPVIFNYKKFYLLPFDLPPEKINEIYSKLSKRIKKIMGERYFYSVFEKIQDDLKNLLV